MKVFLINPNRYKAPPVPPIGLEYISASIERGGHSAEMLDLCFTEDAYKDLDSAVAAFSPDIAGITVRNIDTVLYQTNEFFLDEIREIVGHIKSGHGLKVIIGGTGVSANPEGVLDYLGADFVIDGPAEGNIIECLNEICNPASKRRIYNGRYYPRTKCSRTIEKTGYRKYFENSGIAGFETHKGCSSSCAYCIEANTRVVFKDPEDVVSEVRGIVDMGYSHFHLCDSEFNEDLDYSIEFCNALKKAGMGIKWAVYMKPANFNRKLFSLMKDTGVYLITLTVDSFRKCPMYWSDTEKIVFNAKAAGIKIIVDFLAGFPYEEEDVLLECLDLLRRVQPDSVNINTYIRLYKSLYITRIIMNDAKLKENLLGSTEDDSLIKPVFYNHLTTDRLRELIKGEKIFHIEGFEKTVNYSRVGI
ncbi:MAG: cobalamin-dependent protein [Nitrospirota bacterium]